MSVNFSFLICKNGTNTLYLIEWAQGLKEICMKHGFLPSVGRAWLPPANTYPWVPKSPAAPSHWARTLLTGEGGHAYLGCACIGSFKWNSGWIQNRDVQMCSRREIRTTCNQRSQRRVAQSAGRGCVGSVHEKVASAEKLDHSENCWKVMTWWSVDLGAWFTAKSRMGV